MNPRPKFQLWSNRVELGWGLGRGITPHTHTMPPNSAAPPPGLAGEREGRLLGFFLPSILF